jgi:hypothetical protein
MNRDLGHAETGTPKFTFDFLCTLKPSVVSRR